jgi:2-phospho-L-lactate guanylyltransferase
VQATVRSFDAVTRSGTVLLDDGTELPYGSSAFDASGVRLLRLGQRVRIEVDQASSGREVSFLTIATL